MGEVVKLQKPPPKDRKKQAKPRPRGPRRSRTALVLGGGGFTGGVYEIGALRALDLLAVNRTVNQFDVYVGTSAGSFVARAHRQRRHPRGDDAGGQPAGPHPLPRRGPRHADAPERARVRSGAALLPLRMLGLTRNFVAHLRSASLIDLAVGFAEALPSGLYDGRGMQDYLETVLGDPDRVNDFRMLENELYLTATDLDTCERIVLGGGDWDDVPIARAVAASTALPMIYKPVEIKGRHLIDGGVRSTTNVDVAVEAGAKFVIVVNPLVPYVNDFQKVIPTMWGSRVRRVRDMGFPQIGYQAFKLLAHQRLHEAVSHWKENYPGVDIILIEPDTNDELMFETNVMNFTRRVEIARHGFQSVTLKLASDYDELKATCAKHGIEISATRVRKVVKGVRPRTARRRQRGGASWSRPLARCFARPIRPERPGQSRQPGRRAASVSCRHVTRITHRPAPRAQRRRGDRLEGRAGGMEPVAVHLDHEPLVPPEEVHEVSAERR